MTRHEFSKLAVVRAGVHVSGSFEEVFFGFSFDIDSLLEKRFDRLPFEIVCIHENPPLRSTLQMRVHTKGL